MKDKAHSGRSRTLLRRSGLTIITVFMLLVAIIPVHAGDAPADISNSSVSTYIVVFNDTPKTMMKTMSAQSTSSLVTSCGGQITGQLSTLNGMTVKIPDSEASSLTSLPNVKYVEKDQPMYALLDQAVPQIGANQSWAEGYTGQGVKVAVLDTGVNNSHPDLNGNKVIAWKDFTSGGYTSPHDGHGHGTHVSGIIAGTGAASNGKYKGVAPNASLIEGKVLDDGGVGSTSNIIQAMDWAVSQGAQVISLSLGGNHVQSLDDEIAKVTGEGVVVVVAAGNNGQYGSGTIQCPGDAPAAITVGAVDKSDVIASFSSRGPTSSGSFKPDVTNVGVSVMSAKAGGTAATGYYVYMSGTSMATPMTSGVVALMLQRNSSLTPAQVKNILERTAKPLKVSANDPIPNNDYGWGRVQAKYAVDNVTAASTPLNYTYGPRTVWSDMGEKGSVVGRVTVSVNGTTGVTGAYVALVNASNISQEYNHTISDAFGNYNFTGVNATYSSILMEGPHGQTGQDYVNGTNMYKVYSTKSPYGSGYSAAFGIDANISAAQTTSVVIFPKPARIDLSVERNYLNANGIDNITITAHLYDALGNPVADGYNVNFTVGNAVSNAFTDEQYPWTMVNGSLVSYGHRDAIAIVTGNGNGSSSTQFGWAPSSKLINSTTVWAYYADDPSVNASIHINVLQNFSDNGDILWADTYGALYNEEGYSVKQASDGGYIVAGATVSYGNWGSGGWDGYLVKTDKNGVLEWNKTYGGSGTDYLQSVLQTSDGGYVAVGFTESYGNGSHGSYDVYLIKTDSTGNVQWTRTYGASGNDLGYSIQPTSDGGYIIVGSSNSFSSNGYYQTYLIKADGNGVLQWSRTYGDPSNDQCHSVQQTDDGGYIIAYGSHLVKTDCNGNLEWDKTFSDNTCYSAIQAADGGYIIVGYDPFNGSHGNEYLIKTDRDGNFQWKKLYGGPGSSEAFTVRQTFDGGYVTAGYTNACGNGSWDIYLVKTDSNGQFQWNMTFGGINDEFGYDVQQTTDGGYIVLGTTRSFGNGGMGGADIYLIKTAGNYFIHEHEKLSLDYSYEANINNNYASVNVSRSFGDNENVSVDYSTSDGTAQAGTDYQSVHGTLTFAPSETSKTIIIPLINNSENDQSISGQADEVGRQFYLNIGNPTNSTIWPCNKAPIVLVNSSNNPGEMYEWNYSLVKGWNLISVPLQLSNSSFDSFFPDNVKSHVVVVWAYDTAAKNWKFYTPQTGFDPNTLTDADTEHGYWVKVDQNVSFSISGTAGNATTLQQGWNLVGDPCVSQGDPMETYPGAFVIWQYKNGQWNYYTPQSGYDPNTLNSIEPGYGYWVKVT